MRDVDKPARKRRLPREKRVRDWILLRGTRLFTPKSVARVSNIFAVNRTCESVICSYACILHVYANNLYTMLLRFITSRVIIGTGSPDLRQLYASWYIKCPSNRDLSPKRILLSHLRVRSDILSVTDGCDRNECQNRGLYSHVTNLFAMTHLFLFLFPFVID